MIRAVSFDVFHTLVRDAGAAAAHARRRSVLHEWYVRRDPTITPSRVAASYAKMENRRDAEMDTLRHFPVSEMVAGIGQELGLPAELPGLTQAVRDVLGVGDFVVADGVRACLLACRERGLPLGLISNLGWQTGEFVRSTFEKLDLLAFFEPSACIFSDEVGFYKPHPAPFAACLAGLDRPADEVLHVGDDSVADHEGAGRAGLMTALIASFHPIVDAPPAARVVPSFAALRSFVEGR